MKKLFAFVTLSMGLMFAACGGNGQTTTGEVAADSTVVAADSIATDSVAAADSVLVEVADSTVCPD